MDFQEYKTQVKPITVTLTAGQSLEVEYLPNYMTGDVLAAAESRRAALLDRDDFSLADLHTSLAEELAPVLSKVSVTDNGKKVPFGTFEEKVACLKRLSQPDLKLLIGAINGDIAAPLSATGTDSSDGQPPKE